MSFKFKAIAAAVVLATSFGAHASINSAETGTSAWVTGQSTYDGGSDLIFYAWSSGKSFVMDLGVQAGNFLPSNATSESWSVTSAYNTFISQATGTVRWGVFAARSNTTGVDAKGQDWILTTVRAGATTASINAEKSQLVAQSITPFDTFAHTAPSTAYYSSTTTSDNWATSLKANFATKLNFNADNTVGATGVKFYTFDAVSGGITPAANTLYNGSWSFNGQTIAYTAAVPEPETYAMLLAGLGLVGFIARRRRVI